MQSRRVAVITGGTKGIGKAIACRLAQDGYNVVLNYHADDETAQSALLEFEGLPVKAVAVKADVSVSAGASRLIETAVSQLGPLDLLVNNVGPFLTRTLYDTTDDEWRRTLDSNLSSTFYCSRAALRVMRERRGGSIINIGALNVEHSPIGVFEAPAYYIAKAGVIMLTRSLARSEAPWGIRVNAINPGFIETETYGGYQAEDKAAWAGMVPLGRLGAPDDIAEAVSFLASEKARYVTGAVLHVHGGLWV
ncbi:MAG: SDR family oxidoreductase [Candidatus Methylomirabilis oxygeniifera]|uniref:3-oxoacyl-(Acyl-carrier protein) reductase n=1 Tax=Methylomirabilis oxygeniifera TaxID=671143 RepID=D5MJW6_METO1|nr:MAG: SDR family oxidoreductase [Candidatus Methylomirabilis oxyfera]CBE67549.1 3-oxoacyl-(Acyl-carrier protein) reductase [Candidatus Methylomirabilis oxyfera]